MSDDFWKLLLTLSSFKGFLYVEYEFVRDERRKEFSKLFNTNNSMIFRIIRKYIFDSTETNSRYISCSVGEFKIVWSVDTDFEQIVRKCCLAFKIMYKLNYDLWKISDLKTKKRLLTRNIAKSDKVLNWRDFSPFKLRCCLYNKTEDDLEHIINTLKKDIVEIYISKRGHNRIFVPYL